MAIDYSVSGGVEAGELRMRVGFQTLTEGQSSPYGDSAPDWGEPAYLWAKVELLEGSKLLRAKQIHPEVKAEITFRYNAAVTADGRFVYEGQNYYPVAVIPDPLKRKMVCPCELRPQEDVE